MQGTVLIRSAEELQGYSRSEEDRLEALIKGIADSGARVVVAGSAIGDMALHFVEKYGMMAVRIPSKFDLRRFCRQELPLCKLLEIAVACRTDLKGRGVLKFYGAHEALPAAS